MKIVPQRRNCTAAVQLQWSGRLCHSVPEARSEKDLQRKNCAAAVHPEKSGQDLQRS